RFVPRWTAILTALWFVIVLFQTLLPSTPLSASNWPDFLNSATFIAVLLTVVYAQVYRYRRVSGPVQRQQTRWVVFGFATAIAAFLIAGIVAELVPAFHQPGAAAA